MTTCSNPTNPSSRPVAASPRRRARRTRSAAQQRALQSIAKPLQRRSYTPTGDIGRDMVTAFRLYDEIKRLEAQLAPFRVQFLEHCQKNHLSHMEVGDRTITRKSRARWEYSPALHNELLQLQHQQKMEQRNGVAINNPTEFVSFS